MAVYPYRYSNEPEKTKTKTFYDDFKIEETPLISMVYIQIKKIQRFKGYKLKSYNVIIGSRYILTLY